MLEEEEKEKSGGDSAREHAYKRGGKVIARGARQAAGRCIDARRRGLREMTQSLPLLTLASVRERLRVTPTLENWLAPANRGSPHSDVSGGSGGASSAPASPGSSLKFNAKVKAA